MFTLKSKDDIEDFTNGCCFLGTGGGGNADFGQKMLNDALAAGKRIQFIKQNAVKDNDWIVCPYLMGTSGPETEEIKRAKLAHGLSSVIVENMPASATRLLLKQNPVMLSAIIPYEIGGAATASAIATAAWLDLPTIDADFVGRAVPEATQMLPAIGGVDLCPTASADAFGNETIITKTINQQMTERIGKSLASASFGIIGQATLLRKAGELKKYMLNETLSKSFLIGKTIRDCRENNKCIDEALFNVCQSKKIFEGVISNITGGDKDGYYVGEIIIQGCGQYKDAEFKIWFKNENHLAWLDGHIYLTSPDLISIIDKKSYIPYVNNQLKIGFSVIVFGTASHPAWKEEKALKLQRPRYYGFEYDPKFLFG